MFTDRITPIPWDRLTIADLIPTVRACQRYCASLGANAAPLFRSDALVESARRVFPLSCHTPYSTNMADAFSDYLATKVELLQGRAVKEVRIDLGYPLSLLLVNWRLSLFDGACTQETYGYLDGDCIPGWDTWVAIVELGKQREGHALVCWVPPEVCREVDNAIALDAAGCLSWLAFDPSSMKPLIVGWGQRWCQPALATG